MNQAQDQQIAGDAEMYMLFTSLSSMLMYVECQIAAGYSFDEARMRALKMAAPVIPENIRPKVIGAMRRITPYQLSRAAMNCLVESAYLCYLDMAKKPDTIFRRCAYMWFGLLV